MLLLEYLEYAVWPVALLALFWLIFVPIHINQVSAQINHLATQTCNLQSKCVDTKDACCSAGFFLF